jgi:hypothetical protein
MNREHLYVEYADIRREMSGISPKLETWKKLKTRLDELSEQLGGLKHMYKPDKKKKFIERHQIVRVSSGLLVSGECQGYSNMAKRR